MPLCLDTIDPVGLAIHAQVLEFNQPLGIENQEVATLEFCFFWSLGNCWG